MEKNYIIAGFGGQGVLFAGKTLANAFMIAGKNVTWYPCYGAEMRGGTVNCEIVVSDDEVSSVHKQDIDCLIALNQLSLNKFGAKVKSGGRIIYNSSLATPLSKKNDVEYVSAPISELALELGSAKYANMVVLGILSDYEDLLTLDTYNEALELVLTKNKQTLIDANLKVVQSVKTKVLATNIG